MKCSVKKVAVVVMLVGCLLSFGVLASAASPDHPILVTSAGQSSDDMILKVMLDRYFGKTVERNPLAEAGNLDGINTLVLAVGVSNKGLGSAGINIDQEKARIVSLVDAAKANDIYVILVHIGGPTRRGAGSDEVARILAERADQMIVVTESNQDKFFDQLSSTYGVDLQIVASRNDAAGAIGGLIPAN